MWYYNVLYRYYILSDIPTQWPSPENTLPSQGAGVGDLRHGQHLPVARLADAAVVAIAHRVDGAVRPDLATQAGLLGDLASEHQ